MKHKEKFMLFVFLTALSRAKQQDSLRLAVCADRIPENRIPPNAVNAAMVFVMHMDRGSSRYKWMKQHVN